jgi:threonine/homoserine/homoserine lactone efflux protein
MDLSFFARGMVIGFSIAAPVGPIGVLCIRRTLAEGRAIGFCSGLGAATADALYGAVAAFGLTAVSGALVSQQFWLRLVGGLFLCYLGYKTVSAKPAAKSYAAPTRGLVGAFTTTLLLTITNPATILSFVAVFAGFGLGGSAGDYPAASLMVAGVFLGSAAWWLLLSLGVGLFREKIGPPQLRWINWLSGALLAGFGLAALWSVVR